MSQSLETVPEEYEGTLAFYLATEPGELADLEIAAAAAIHWAKGIKAAANILDPSAEYRVTLVAARPGSSNWIARLEELREKLGQSKANQAAERVKDGWQKVPLIARIGIGLAVVVPTTAAPSIEYWFGDDGFTETQKQEMEDIYRQVVDEPSVKAQRTQIYKETPRDRKITGVGTGIPTSDMWKPKNVLPANRFAEAGGLFFDLDAIEEERERTIPQALDVILVTPRLENARRAWTFRQEGIPGTFNAEMTDTTFLQALERPGGIREVMRANIPMRIEMEIDQERIGGEWKAKRRGRRIVKVVSPAIE